MNGATPLFPLYAFMAWTGTTLYLLMYCLFKDSVLQTVLLNVTKIGENYMVVMREGGLWKE